MHSTMELPFPTAVSLLQKDGMGPPRRKHHLTGHSQSPFGNIHVKCPLLPSPHAGRLSHTAQGMPSPTSPPTGSPSIPALSVSDLKAYTFPELP